MGITLGFSEILILLLAMGGHNDLLDYIQTKAYWELKGVQPSVATMAAELGPAKAEPKPTPAGSVRRLMAIRTLGESKDPQALPVLRPLVKSERRFEGDYAEQAIAAIEGKPFARPQPPGARWAADASLLPATTGTVAHLTMVLGHPPDVGKMLKDARVLAGDGPAARAFDEFTKQVVALAERVGNFRVHAFTLGLSEALGEGRGFAILVVRGLYDSPAAQAALAQAGRCKVATSLSGIKVLQPEESIALLLPSDECFVLVVGAQSEEMPLGSMLGALQRGTGGLTAGTDLGKMLASLDTTQPIWGAIKIGEGNPLAGPLGIPFDSATFVGRMEGETQKLKLVAVGKGTQEVAATVAAIEKGLPNARAAVVAGAEKWPLLKPLADLMATVAVKAEGPTATFTATFNGPPAALITPMLSNVFALTESLRRGPPPRQRFQPRHRNGPAPGPDDF